MHAWIERDIQMSKLVDNRYNDSDTHTCILLVILISLVKRIYVEENVIVKVISS
jgi:hypothetical protein